VNATRLAMIYCGASDTPFNSAMKSDSIGT
jgi:hypothetical protein